MPQLKQVSPGIRIGSPIERLNLTIFPLFADDVVHDPNYRTMGDALRAGSARISEISEGGSVPTLALENLTDIPVLIIDGEELIGARQNRIANLTVLAPGNTTLPLPVSCVERGRWSYRTREFAESADIAYNTARAKKARAVSRNLVAKGDRVSYQSEVWSEIDSISARLGINSPTSAMQDVYESRRSSVNEYVTGVEVADGQVGAVFAINGAPAGVEMFDSTDTFRNYLPKILRSYALDAIANGNFQRITAEEAEAQRLLDSILELDAKSFPAVGLGQDLRIDSETLSGGALAHEGRLIHLAAFQTLLPDSPTPGGSDEEDIRPMVIRQGHMLIRGGHGRLALLDTGSPMSIGRGEEYRLGSRLFNPSKAMQSVLDVAGEHIGRRVHWLFGHDFFAEQRVLLDWRARELRILPGDSEAHGPRGRAIPIDVVMGVPVVTGRTATGQVRAIIDSGAALSYVPAAVVQGLTPVGRRTDFYPGFGEFETDVWKVRTEIGGRRLTVTAGILPPMLSIMFGMLLGSDGWIVGSDFFRNRAIIVDYPGRRFIDVTD